MPLNYFVAFCGEFLIFAKISTYFVLNTKCAVYEKGSFNLKIGCLSVLDANLHHSFFLIIFVQISLLEECGLLDRALGEMQKKESKIVRLYF